MGSTVRGYVLWEGSSLIDGKPIVVVVTSPGSNRKTGAMWQSWIIRSDVHPLHAIRIGDDVSVCGACRHRGAGPNARGRSCYVAVQHAPAGIYRAYRAGRYLPLDFAALAGAFLRIGSYGDPAAVPVGVWRALVSVLAGWTGYTHQWSTCDPAYADVLVASVDSVDEFERARAAGWKTFRVRHTGADLEAGEIVCPASAEAGHRLTCIQCRVCSGNTGQRGSRNVVIYAHGSSRRNFFRSAQKNLLQPD